MKRKFYLAFAGAIISLVFLVAVFHRVDWSEFFSALRSVRVAWLFAGICAEMTAIMTRSLRWNVISGSSPRRHFWSFWRAQTLGYLGNAFFPARAGELIRAVALQRLIGLRGPHAVSSVVMDRVADGLGAVLFLVAALWDLKIDFLQRQSIALFALFFFCLALLSAALVVWGGRLSGLVGRFGSRPSSLADMLAGWCSQASQEAQHLRRPGTLVVVALSTLLAFACDALAAWLVMLAFGWYLPPMAGAIVILFLALATSLPSTPGYVGIYQIACILALRFYHVNDSEAIAYAVVFQLATNLLILTQGGAVLSTYGLRNFRLSMAGPNSKTVRESRPESQPIPGVS